MIIKTEKGYNYIVNGKRLFDFDQKKIKLVNENLLFLTAYSHLTSIYCLNSNKTLLMYEHIHKVYKTCFIQSYTERKSGLNYTYKKILDFNLNTLVSGITSIQPHTEDLLYINKEELRNIFSINKRGFLFEKWYNRIIGINTKYKCLVDSSGYIGYLCDIDNYILYNIEISLYNIRYSDKYILLRYNNFILFFKKKKYLFRYVN